MRRVLAVALISLAAASAGPPLYLKTRTIETGETARPAARKESEVHRAEGAGRTRLLIQFGHPPADEDVAALLARDIAVLAYVHENGLMVACGDCSGLEELDLTWISRLDPSDKISPLLADLDDAEPRAVIVELHGDVDPNDGRRIVLEEGGELIESPDLAARHVLARVDREQLHAIAAREEVAYLFPPLAALSSGEPLVACAGALSGPGATVGQYTAKVGEGWDGPGTGAASVGYFFQTRTRQLPVELVESETLRAFAEWARVVQLTFTPAARSTAFRTINIQWASRAHDDPYPFDGPGGILAHTFYPAPPNPEPLAGDMHFDEDEAWRVGASTDLFSVALHELGHALGLGHSDQPGSVMYPYYARQSALTSHDIAAIRELYAAREAASPAPPAPEPPTAAPDPPPSQPITLNVQTPPSAVAAESILLLGSASGGNGAITVTWRSDRGHSGAAAAGAVWSAEVPLEMGANRITVTASDSSRSTSALVSVERRAPAVSPLTIQITYPGAASAFSVSVPTITLRGTAAHASGIARVAWTNARAESGAASGTASWDSGAIALVPGSNAIVVSARANDGTTASRTVYVDYAAATTRDTTAPALSIASPASATFTTDAESIVLSGTARDNVGVTEVVWFSSTGPTGKASGTAAWNTPPIPLLRGYNSIVVRAFDAAGNMGWRSVGVTRR